MTAHARAIVRHPGAVPAVLTTALLSVVGIAAVLMPILVVALIGVVVALYLLTDAQRATTAFLGAVAVVLAGYAFFGRGFAYLGARPLYVGEVALALGLVALPIVVQRRRLGLLHVLLILFMVWGALCTIPHLSTYGVDAARDAVLWGYALFALVLSLALRREHFPLVVDLYGRIAPWLVRWIPLSMALYYALGNGGLPKLPGTNVTVINYKGGDLGVHLTILAAFLLLGFYERSRRSAPGEWAFKLAWVAGAILVLAVSRATFLTLSVGLGLVFLVRHSSARRVRLVGVLVATCVVMLVLNPSVPVGQGNAISPSAFATSFVSIFSSTAGADETTVAQDLQGSRHFRLAWWKEIADYTFHGPYFWTGKGYGINLADADGFSVGKSSDLRAPHNSTMTVLARSGVPGLVLWLLLQGVFVTSLLVALQRARRAGATYWYRFDTLLLVAWAAMVINTSFDPYLEGPQGGIWFWSVVGAGIAGVHIQNRDLPAGRLDPRTTEEAP